MIKSVIAIATLCVSTCAAYAQTTNPLLLSVGWMHSAPIHSGGTLTPRDPNTSTPARISSVSDSDYAGVSATYFLDDHIATELSLGIAQSLNIYSDEPGQTEIKVAKAKQWSPTLSLKYYFLDPSSNIRPYLGLGVSHTWFSNVRPVNAGPGDAISLKNDLNLVLQAGLIYQSQTHWFAGASVSYMPLRTKTTVTMAEEGHRDIFTSRVKINPVTTNLYIGYRF